MNKNSSIKQNPVAEADHDVMMMVSTKTRYFIEKYCRKHRTESELTTPKKSFPSDHHDDLLFIYTTCYLFLFFLFSHFCHFDYA